MKYLVLLALTLASASYAVEYDMVRCTLSESISGERYQTVDVVNLRNGYNTLMSGKDYIAQASESNGQINVSVNRILDGKGILRTRVAATSNEGKSVGVDVQVTDEKNFISVYCRTTLSSNSL